LQRIIQKEGSSQIISNKNEKPKDNLTKDGTFNPQPLITRQADGSWQVEGEIVKLVNRTRK
jgi:hypothetical protein